MSEPPGSGHEPWRTSGGEPAGGHRRDDVNWGSGSTGWGTPPPPPKSRAAAGASGAGTPGGPSGAAPADLRPLSVGDVLDGTVRTLVRDWRVLLGAAAAVYIPLQLVLWAAAPDFATSGPLEAVTAQFEEGFGPGAPGAGPGAPDFEEVFGSPAQAAALPLVLLVQSLVVSPLIAAAVVHVVGRRRLGRPTGVGDALRTAAGRLHVLVGVRLLLGLLVVAAAIVAGVVLALLGAGLGAVIGGVAALVVVPVGLAAVLAFVGVLVLFAVVTPAVVLERAGPVAAMGRSARLVRRRFWPTVGRVLLVGLLVWIVSALLALLALPAELLPGDVGFFALSSLTEIVALPLLPTALTLIYLDLRVRTEGLDLSLALGSGQGEELGGWREEPGDGASGDDRA